MRKCKDREIFNRKRGERIDKRTNRTSSPVYLSVNPLHEHKFPIGYSNREIWLNMDYWGTRTLTFTGKLLFFFFVERWNGTGDDKKDISSVSLCLSKQMILSLSFEMYNFESELSVYVNMKNNFSLLHRTGNKEGGEEGEIEDQNPIITPLFSLSLSIESHYEWTKKRSPLCLLISLRVISFPCLSPLQGEWFSLLLVKLIHFVKMEEKGGEEMRREDRDRWTWKKKTYQFIFLGHGQWIFVSFCPISCVNVGVLSLFSWTLDAKRAILSFSSLIVVSHGRTYLWDTRYTRGDYKLRAMHFLQEDQGFSSLNLRFYASELAYLASPISVPVHCSEEERGWEMYACWLDVTDVYVDVLKMGGKPLSWYSLGRRRRLEISLQTTSLKNQEAMRRFRVSPHKTFLSLANTHCTGESG